MASNRRALRRFAPCRAGIQIRDVRPAESRASPPETNREMQSALAWIGIISNMIYTCVASRHARPVSEMSFAASALPVQAFRAGECADKFDARVARVDDLVDVVAAGGVPRRVRSRNFFHEA